MPGWETEPDETVLNMFENKMKGLGFEVVITRGDRNITLDYSTTRTEMFEIEKNYHRDSLETIFVAYVRNAIDYENYRGVTTIGGGVFINENRTVPDPTHTLAVFECAVLMHEIGHCLLTVSNLDHCDDKGCCMYAPEQQAVTTYCQNHMIAIMTNRQILVPSMGPITDCMQW